LLAWDCGTTSAREIVRTLNQVGDNEQNEGCEDDEDENTDSVDDVFLELESRSSRCGNAYPYSLNLGQNLEHQQIDLNNRQAIVYRYLLLCTRLNMKTNHRHAGINGTELFEKYSAFVMRTYLGFHRAQAMVFGTSVEGGFAKKVEELCTRLNEGGTYLPVDISGADAKDDKLDALAWVPFGDSNPGKIILFGQSKTGTSWPEQLTQSRPIDFARKWFSTRNFWVEPVRALCVAESVDPDRWPSTCISGGLLMDRSRLVEFSELIDDGIFDEIHRWTVQAKSVIPSVNKD